MRSKTGLQRDYSGKEKSKWLKLRMKQQKVFKPGHVMLCKSEENPNSM
jgi:hypothetical protein